MNELHLEEYVRQKHYKQVRQDGSPYARHPIEVAQLLKRYVANCSDTMLVAAYLHDVIEDTSTTYEDIENDFGKNVADLVLELTNDEQEKNALGKKDYLVKKMNSMSDDAFSIKLVDRLHNVMDMKCSTEEFKSYYKDQTLHIFSNLKREYSDAQEAIVEDILERLKKC